jgi:1-acyl-sn-glycerol-3-phosphate acyltransferase
MMRRRFLYGHAFVILPQHDGSVFLMALRVACLSLSVAAGFAIALILPQLGAEERRAAMRFWARSLLWSLGVRLRISGELPHAPGLIVANHISWMDVIALIAVCPAAFVCKSEVAAWPGIGWLLARADTIFIRRGSFRDALRVNEELGRRWHDQETIAIFPEGTTTDGSIVLPFRAALFQPALERGLAIYPAAIVYSSPEASYVGDTSFAESLLTIARANGLEVRLAFLQPLAAAALNRKQAAAAARFAIAAESRLSLGAFAKAARARRRHAQRLALPRFARGSSATIGRPF